MKTKHSPGPWRRGKNGGAIVCDREDSWMDAESLAWYGGHVVCESVNPVDMDLIMAAPRMLEALLATQSVVADLMEAVRQNPALRNRKGLEAAIVAAGNTIAEAVIAATEPTDEPENPKP